MRLQRLDQAANMFAARHNSGDPVAIRNWRKVIGLMMRGNSHCLIIRR